MSKPKLIIFSSGTKDGGGSGFRNLVEQNQIGVLNADIVGVVSNHENGGVRKYANEFGVRFIHFAGPWEKEKYQEIVKNTGAEWVSLSGWLKLASGLDGARTINIHPGPLPRFGGKGMYGKYVHEAVIEAYKKGEVTESAISMHFVTEKYDEGPLFFHFPVKIRPEDNAESLQARVNAIEHAWQPFITNLVIHKKISWNGVDPSTLSVPEWYPFLAAF